MTNPSIDIIFGTIGMALTCYGITVPLEKRFRPLLLGALALTVVAIAERHWTFVALEGVVMVGIFVSELRGREILKTVVPVVTGVVATAALSAAGLLDSFEAWIGAVGLLLTALGYATMHPLTYFVGGIVLLVYSLLAIAAGAWIGIFWALMNIIFCVIVWRQLREPAPA